MAFCICAKNGRTSLKNRRYTVGEMDCWSCSTLEKSGWIVATNDAVRVIGIDTSAPERVVVPSSCLADTSPTPNKPIRGWGRAPAALAERPLSVPAYTTSLWSDWPSSNAHTWRSSVFCTNRTNWIGQLARPSPRITPNGMRIVTVKPPGRSFPTLCHFGAYAAFSLECW